MNSFSLTGRLCSGGKQLSVIFATYFILRGHDTNINILRLLFTGFLLSFVIGGNKALIAGNFVTCTHTGGVGAV